MTLTYKKEINDVTNNAVVLDVCGKIAELLMVPYSRVTDAYGGYKGKPSPIVAGAAAAKTAAAGTKNSTAANSTNSTANSTRRMLNTTNATNATAAPKEYPISMFVQPDPFASADQIDNDATVTTLKGDLAKAAIDSVTKAKFGAMTVTAAVTAEVAIAWNKEPSAAGGAQKITLSGSTNAAGYVYCGVSKNPASRLRVLNSTNSSNATNATAGGAAKPAAAEVTNIRSANAAASWHLNRVETGIKNVLTFSMDFTGLGVGKTYKWACVATSLNPVNPKYTTSMKESTAQTTAAPAPVTVGDSALWSSLFAAIIMIAAVFFY